MLGKQLFSAIILSLIAASALAQTDGGVSIKLLSGIYAQAIEQVHALKDQLEQAKIANDTALSARQTLSDVKDEYEFVSNFNPEAELQNIIGEFDDLTNLNELVKAKNFDEKWSLAYGEIDKRFKASDKNSKDGAAAGDAKRALEQLKVMEELRNAYVDQAINLDTKATDKDLQRRIASASSMTASLAIDQKIHDIENRIAGIQRVMSGLEWDADFESYLKSTEKKSLTGGVVTSFLVYVLDPNAIYESILKLHILVGFIPWILALAIVIRNMQESAAGLVGKAALADAFLSMNRTALIYLIYSVTGLALFGFILTFSSLFSGFGSEEGIHQQLLSLRSSFNAPTTIDKDLVQKSIEGLLDVTNIFSAGFLFIVYQAVSVCYVAISQFIDVLFAVFVAVAYAWGYFAIGSMTLKGPLNMIDGWIKNVAGMAVWAILVPFLFGILWFMSEAGRVWLQKTYGDVGFGSTAFAMWQGYTIVILVMMITLKILAITLSAKLVSNQAMQGEFAKAATIMSAFAGGQLAETGGNSAKDYTKSLLPNVQDGNRLRDGVGQKVSDFFNSPVRDTVRSAAQGMGDLATRLTGSGNAQPQPNGDSGTNSNAPNGSPASGSSSAPPPPNSNNSGPQGMGNMANQSPAAPASNAATTPADGGLGSLTPDPSPI